MPKNTKPGISSAYETQKKRTEELYKQIVELHNDEHLGCRAIAKRLNIGRSTISRHLAAWRNGIPVEEMKPYCRPPKVTPQIRSALGQLVAKQNVPTSKSLATWLSTSMKVYMASRTVRNHLVALDYKNSIPRSVPKLTVQQQQKRVDWCRQHSEFDWKNVWFSDETYIEINRSTIPVWHKKGQRPTVAKSKFSAKIMCWGAISTRFKSKLAVVQGTMTADRYIGTLQGYLLDESCGFNSNRDVFHQDNLVTMQRRRKRFS